MQFALVNNKRVFADKTKKNAICECCKKPVKAYCGELIVYHFRHEKGVDCDNWYEPITKWHLDWQSHFNINNREVPISKGNKTHRPDIVNNQKTVIEFQHSYISPKEIKEREIFYDRMIWVFDGSGFVSNFLVANENFVNKRVQKFNLKITNTPASIIPTYKSIGYCWLHAKKHVFCCQKPTFIDFGTSFLYWINFHIKTQPKFIKTRSFLEYHSHENPNFEGYEYWDNETEYCYYPVKCISKENFLSHYSKIGKNELVDA